MRICKLCEIANFKTGKLNSNASKNEGRYPFFTCAPEPLKIDTYAFDTKAIILAGNNAEGNFHIQYFEGKFNAYQRTYVIETIDDTIVDIRYLFYALKMCLKHFKLISQGTATKFLTAKILNAFELPIPEIDLQQKLVSLLAAIDDKIEENQKINENLAA
jgi:type I restriction-modification system specificity protein